MTDQHYDRHSMDPNGASAHGESGFPDAGTGAGERAGGWGAEFGGGPGGVHRMPMTGGGDMPPGMVGGTVGGGAWPQQMGGGWRGQGGAAYGGPIHGHHGQDAGMVVEHEPVGPAAAVHDGGDQGGAWGGHESGGRDQGNHAVDTLGHHDYGHGDSAHHVHGADAYQDDRMGEGRAEREGYPGGEYPEHDYEARGRRPDLRGAGDGDGGYDDAWDEVGETPAGAGAPVNRGADARGGAQHGDADADELVAGLDDGLDDVVVAPVGRQRRELPLGAKIGFGVGAAVVVGIMGLSGYAIFFKGGGTNADVARERLEVMEDVMPQRRVMPVDPMTAMVAGHGNNPGGGAGGWSGSGAHPAADRQAPAAPALMIADVGGAGRVGPGAGEVAVAPVAAPGPASPVPVPVTAATVSAGMTVTAPVVVGGASAAMPGGAANGVAGGGEDLRRLVEGLSVQVAALTAKLDAAKPGPDIEALRRDLAAMSSRVDAVEQGGAARAATPTTVTAAPVAVKAGGVNPEAAKEVARAAADEAARKTKAEKDANERAAVAAAKARQQRAVEARSKAAAERDASGKGCRLHGATDATFGGASGVAWISSRGQEAQQVEVGQKAPCIGKVTAIFADARDWVVRGAGGTLRMPHGG